MTTAAANATRSTDFRRPLAPEARQAAARMVISASRASGKTPEQWIVDIADGKELS
mgnify:CR=1 FL=1